MSQSLAIMICKSVDTESMKKMKDKIETLYKMPFHVMRRKEWREQKEEQVFFVGGLFGFFSLKENSESLSSLLKEMVE